ncbi:poly(A)-specific ribonuclease PARN [Elysia marginata]|uniref:Poly(A)-specific ribonuclease PARN n=1 Tax=Elysia marginata TaxID=1093978 RepID=A0AAV4ET29_9GAST|nr:poly(A)-specific ribonuclease PARN [Elysia marginata]
MDITKHNFYEELDNILKAIEESTFLSIDGEFTGLDAEGCSHCAPFDTPSERYSKLKNGSTDFLLLQVGLCAFKVDEGKRMYEAKPYNFYLFPSVPHRSAPDKRFMCQSSSIDFLVSQGFDFNKVFREGIPYLTAEQEHQMRCFLEQKHSEQSNQSFSAMEIPENQREFMEDICEKIDAFMAKEDAEPLEIKGCNGLQRKLVYQTVEEKYPLARLETKTGENKERYLLLHGAKNSEELAKIDRERQAAEMMELDIQVGFSKVFQAITKAEKLVVGHNMFLDVLHCIKHFHSSLPDDLEDFKSLVTGVLPRLVDTKLISSTPPLKDFIEKTSLGELHEALQSKPFKPVTIKTAPGFERYTEEETKLHEAGYDAFITGSCFATMCKFLGSCQKPATDFLLPSSSVIKTFVNKLYLMRIADIQYLTLDGPDMEVNRDHVFYVTFPKEWRMSDLFSLFEPYGNIQISWLSNTSALVGLHNKKNAKIAFEALSKEKGLFHVSSYAFYHRNKALKWSAAAVKRKNSEELELPPNKIKRQSLDADRNSSIKKPVTEASSEGEAQSGDNSGRKLFDESTDW